MSLLSALNDALTALPIQPEDAAVVELARVQAQKIDDGDPRGVTPMLDILIELGMTPKARNAVMRGPQVNDGASDKITDLRSRRQQRQATQ